MILFSDSSDFSLNSLFISKKATIRDTLQVIDTGALGFALVVNENDTFHGLVTDGDIRRALLTGCSLDSNISDIIKPHYVTSRVDEDWKEIARKFNHKIRFIPILDKDDKVTDIAVMESRLRIPVAEPKLGKKELEYVTDCILSGWISSSGEYIKKFESGFADYCNCSYGVATSNGTTALHLALLALGIGPGDEVLVPDLTFIATANAVTYTGAKPVFVDIESDTWNIDPKELVPKINRNTKGIIAVHLYGHPADMDPLLEIAKKNNIWIIEDAAEAHGAEYKGRKVGGIGDIGVFSFYGNKIITTGEGGMVVTNSLDIAERVQILRDHGMDKNHRYWHPYLGYNYRMTNMQAAVGLAQLERIDEILEKKIAIADEYNRLLGQNPFITVPPRKEYAKNVYWMYSILLQGDFGEKRDELMDYLGKYGIDTRPFFPPLHQQPIYQNKCEDLIISNDVSKRGLNLPSSPNINSGDIQHISTKILDYLNHH